MKSTLAMAVLPGGGGGRVEECVQRNRRDAGPEEKTALGAVEGLPVGVTGHLEEDLAEPVVGGVAEPDLARDRVLGVNERLREPGPEHLAQLGIVLGLLVVRPRRVAEIDAD